MKEYVKNLFLGPWSILKGMRVTIKNFFSKAVTVQYPDKKLVMSSRFRGLVDLYPEKCIICYQCVKICPTGCLAIKHKESAGKKKELEAFEYAMEFCCFCGLCEQVCPKGAIYMNKIYEVATSDHEKLYINLLDPKKYDEWANPTVK